VCIQYFHNQFAEYIVTDTYVTYAMGTGTKEMPAQQQAYLQAAKDAGLSIPLMPSH
jgi:hypothetical protein